MQLFTNDYVVLDFETGGLSRTARRPVETGLLRYKDGRVTLRHHLVHPPLDGDLDFFIEPGALGVHGISREMCEAEGWHPKATAQAITEAVGDMPVWGHNAVRFDFPIMVEEAKKCGLLPVPQAQWRDTAALYKAWRMQKYPSEYPSFLIFMQKVLGTPRRGLLYNLPFLTKELDLGIRVLDADGNRTDVPSQMARLEIDSHLGVSEEDRLMIENLGAHRAAFDVVVTHALIQWCRKNIGHLFVAEDTAPAPGQSDAGWAVSDAGVLAAQAVLDYAWGDELSDYVEQRREGLPANDASHVFTQMVTLQNDLPDATGKSPEDYLNEFCAEHKIPVPE